MTDSSGSASPPTSNDPHGIVELLDRIVKKHHAFTRTAVSNIADLAKSISDTGEHQSAYIRLREAAAILANDLLTHLQKEESVLFPYIEHLEASASEGTPVSLPAFGSVANPIRMMRLEHEESDNVLKRVRYLTDDYTPPDSASSELRSLYQMLKELDSDLREHVRLEDELLFPLAIRLEQEVLGDI